MRRSDRPCLAVVCAALTLCLSCRSRPAKTGKDAEKAPPYLQEPVRLAPFHVRPTVGAGQKEGGASEAVEIYDAAALFSRASKEYRHGRYAAAAEIYLQTAREFPISSYASAALYNGALAFERVGRFDRAAYTYKLLMEAYPRSEDVTDALFRLLGCQEALEEWEAAVRTANELLFERSDLTDAERVECLARKGAAAWAAGDREEAEAALKEAVYRFTAHKEPAAGSALYYAAMARFKMGEILEEQMRSVFLPAEENALKDALEEKCQRLLDAQTEYTDAIRLGEAHWAAASAYRIGKLYRNLWEDMVAAPPPSDLGEEEREIYVEVLKERIQVLLEKAVRQWERVVKMGKRLELDDEWVETAEAEIREVRRRMLLQRQGVESGGSADRGESSSVSGAP